MRITVVVMYDMTKEATIVYDIIQTTSENNKPIIISKTQTTISMSPHNMSSFYFGIY